MIRLRKSYSWREIVAVLIAAIVALSVLVYGTQRYLVSARGNRFDFYPPWRGAQAILSGQTPYTDDITRAIQIGMFGEKLPEEVNQHAFAYPAHLAVVLLPIFLLPFEIAISVWASLQLAFLEIAVLIWLRLVVLRIKLQTMLALLIITTVVFRYPMIVYVLGQFIGFSMLCLVVAASLLQYQRFGWAGVLLALSSIRPEYMVIAVGISAYYAWRGHWSVSATLLATVMVLITIAILLVGFWIPDFLRAALGYSTYSNVLWPPSLIGPTVGVTLFLVLAITLSLYGIMLAADDTALVVSIIVSTVLLIFPLTGSYALTLLLLPLLTAWRIYQSPIEKLVLLSIVVSPWGFLMLTNKGIVSTNLDILFIPIFVLLALLVALRKWQSSGANPISQGSGVF